MEHFFCFDTYVFPLQVSIWVCKNTRSNNEDFNYGLMCKVFLATPFYLIFMVVVEWFKRGVDTCTIIVACPMYIP